MKFKNYTFIKLFLFSTIAIAAITFFSSAVSTGFSTPSSPTTLGSTEEANQMIVQNVSEGSNFFANAACLNGADIYRFMSATGSNTVAVYFGYSMGDNYSNTNKVMVIAPVDRNYKTISSANCLLYNSSNMTYQPYSLEDNITPANSSQQYISAALAKSYTTNFDENPNKEDVKAVLLQRSTLDKFIKNNGAVANNLLLSFGKDLSGNIVVVVSSKGAAARSSQADALDGSSLCPNNCDFY